MKSDKPNILLLGSRGFLGSRMMSALIPHYSVLGVSRQEPLSSYEKKADILCHETLKSLLEDSHWDVVINCVGLTQVDLCEKDQTLAMKLNYELVAEILEILTPKPKALYVGFSTNGVYDGLTPLYHEDSLKKPVNFYGKTKAMADDLLCERRSLSGFLLLRIMTLYGFVSQGQRDNPVTFIAKALMRDQPIRLVDDVFNNLLYVDDVPRFFMEVFKRGQRGVFNLAADEVISRYELGCRVCQYLSKPRHLVERITSNDLPNLAPRAPNTSFYTQKAKSLPFIFTSLEEGLPLCLKNRKNIDNV